MEANDANGLARGIEAVMRPRLTSLAERYDVIGDVRGRGAMLAIELVKPGTTDPNPELAGELNRYCHQHGVVTLTTGTHGNVFRFLPPLTIGTALLEDALGVLDQAFEAHAG